MSGSGNHGGIIRIKMKLTKEDIKRVPLLENGSWYFSREVIELGKVCEIVKELKTHSVKIGIFEGVDTFRIDELFGEILE